MTPQPVRNYLQERNTRIQNEWKIYQKAHASSIDTLQLTEDSDLKRLYHGSRDYITEQEKAKALQSEYDKYAQSQALKNLDKHEPFEFYETRLDPLPANRQPNDGLTSLPLRYHKGQTVSTTESTPETGFDIDIILKQLINTKYPQYLAHIAKYCRPLGTTDATFSDFNREQVTTQPATPERENAILEHIHYFLDIKPYLPIHFVDTQFAKLPISTGTGYHNRHSFKTNAHAKYSHPKEYAEKPTSKGYYLNAFLERARTLIHLVKLDGFPFEWTLSDDPSDDDFLALIDTANKFLNEYPTILFTRNHISDRDGKLKQRPVYAVDELFLLLETMLTFPALVQARKHSCCIMYGLETIRGSNRYLDAVAQRFKSYFTIDWSFYDQTIPRPVTDSYYLRYLPSLIVINQAYHPTYEYPTYPDLTEHKMYTRISNLLSFLHLWYNNMTFITSDGFPYRRTACGVPSGMLNTQLLDSYCNLYLIIDALIEFGCTHTEIRDITLFIMGDDNSGFTNWPLTRLESFITFFTSYALKRWNMTISLSKSTVTSQRQNIETLSYRCNFGSPLRPIPKLVAQLCYPEHGMKRQFMSYRAIGIAYAASGMDDTLHNFCKDIYHTYLPYAAPLTSDTILNITKFLPGQFKLLDSYAENVDLTFFPPIEMIRTNLSTWKGPLTPQPKWNLAHFINPPDHTESNSKTLAEYELEHNIPRHPPPQL